MDGEKGRRFLESIDEQSGIQWRIVARVAALAGSGWESPGLRAELEELVRRHEEITRELNGIDAGASQPRVDHQRDEQHGKVGA